MLLSVALVMRQKATPIFGIVTRKGLAQNIDEIDDMLVSWENLFNEALEALVNQTPWISNAILRRG